MSEIERVPSSVFRVTYASIAEPVAVTVLGRVIGWWTPVPRPEQKPTVGPVSAQAEASDGVLDAPAMPSSSGPVARPGTAAAPGSTGSTAPMTQSDRDAVLRRVAKGRG